MKRKMVSDQHYVQLKDELSELCTVKRTYSDQIYVQ